MNESELTPNWSPFVIAEPEEKLPHPRSIKTPEGMGDRMRVAAFAEIQAREAFAWAAQRYQDAPKTLRNAWKALSIAEDRHLHWILNRMEELGLDVKDRPVSDKLWHSLVTRKTAKEFALYMANAEERGRQAGERFHQSLHEKDPVTAEIFRKIAEEEVAHIEVALKHYPEEELKTAPPHSSG
jgi:uncharacterized ferritin-like protein (DUF455 family)